VTLSARDSSREIGSYSEKLTDHVMTPRNGGPIQSADLTGHAGTPGRGALIILYLEVDDDCIKSAKYQ
jgi:nitrogen fixation NifU-like protein